LCVPTPIAPSATIVFQCRRIVGQSRRTCGRANGARISSAKSQRKNVIAIGGMSWCRPRPTIQFTDQNSGVSASSR
jgi:hypothetical protein